ncbi:helix-turn-helix transcriptional regulator [Bradyrhizobium sp. BRP14]|nr:helix-turn-helix transcriptional regulator [Bradyrhizobium sp. BRP14]
MAAKSPNPIDVHVGSRIRLQRMMRKMSQSALGDAVGTTFQQIQKYEKGTNRVSASRMQQFADLLHVPISFFFEGQPEGATASADKLPSDELSLFLSTSEGLALNRGFIQIKDEQLRRKLVGLVKAAAGQDS